MEDSVVFAAWQSTDPRGLLDSLGDEVVFSSPVADYAGRAKAGHLLVLIPRTMGRQDVVGQWMDDRRVATAFTAPVGDRHIDGLLLEEQGPDGLLAHVTLFLRPLTVLRDCIDDIRERLARDPLPD